MIENITIESIIATTNIEEPVDLEHISQYIKCDMEYVLNEEDEEIPLSITYVYGDGISITLFNTGKIVSTKAKTVEDAEQSIQNFVNLITNLEDYE